MASDFANTIVCQQRDADNQLSNDSNDKHYCTNPCAAGTSRIAELTARDFQVI
jgi:hypothetical protein